MTTYKEQVPRTRFPRGEEHPNSKLTRELVVKIRAARGSHAKIGRLFGVSAACVGRIKRGESWSWLRAGLARA